MMMLMMMMVVTMMIDINQGFNEGRKPKGIMAASMALR